MEFGNKQFKNLKIISSTAQDGTVIIDINLPTEKIAIINGQFRSPQNPKKAFQMLHFYSSKTAAKLHEMVLPCEYLKEVQFSKLGNFLAIFGLSSEIIVICMQSETKELKLLKNGHQSFVDQVAINHNETILISAGLQDFICIWNLDNFSLIQTIEMEKHQIKEIQSLSISKNNVYFVAACDEERIAVWQKGKESKITFIFMKDGCNKLEFHTNSCELVLAQRKFSNSVLVVNLTNLTILRQMELFSVKLSCLNYKNNSEIVNIAQNNLFQKYGCISQWNWVSGILLEKQNYEEAIFQIDLQEQDKIIISKKGSSIKFWV